MATNIKTTESKFFERTRTALANAQSHPAIKAALNEYGMTDEVLAGLQDLYSSSLKTWEDNTQQDAEQNDTSNQYKILYIELQNMFKEHRDKVKLFFEREPEVLVKLGIKGVFPTKYNDFFDKVKQFYSTLQTDETLLVKTTRIKIDAARVDAALVKLNELLSKRSDFDRENAESQDMTQKKNTAIIEIKEQMDEFDSIAKIALYNQPQLLEALGIFVRN